MKQTFKLRSVFHLRYLIALSFFALLGFHAYTQTTDSIPKPAKELKNSIKINLTSMVIWDNSFQLSYERVINKNQTLNVFGGYNEFPVNLSLDLDNTSLSNTSNRSGYSFGADYRFYLAKENKYAVPHGVYLAPFISFYNFKADRTLTHTDSTGTQSSSGLNTKISFVNIGGVLGYQFVLGRRWVIDAMVFGPALTKYNFKARIESDLPGLDENEAAQAIIDALKEKLPLLNDLSSEEGVSGSGTQAFWSVGFRYSISIGFRF